MWSDNDIDETFQRLAPPNPEPASFPLDAWLRLETQLDKAVIEREVRRKLWRYFAAEVAVVALVALGWLLRPTSPAAPAGPAKTSAVAPESKRANTALAPAGPARISRYAAATSPVAATSVAVTAPAASGPSSLAPLTTTVKLPTARAAVAPQAPRLLAAVVPGMPRRQSRKARPTAESRAASQGLTVSVAAAGASGRISRRAEGIAAYPARKAAVSTAASATADGATAGSGAAEKSLTYTASASAPRRPHQAASARPGAPAAASFTPPGDGHGAAGQKIEQETVAKLVAPAALAWRPVALRPAAASELPTPLAAVAPIDDAPAAIVLPAPARRSRLIVGLVGAPDVSTVKFASVERPLPNVGLTLEYHLGSRLRLSTGLLRSTKQYEAQRDDYDWGANRYRVYQRNFEYVDATCTVLDVPLNLRYDLIARPRYQVFGSAGLSSFFMQRERYTYGYLENNQSNLWERVAVNENQHLFSIVNLSLGYERRLSGRWSVQAEPYLKLPLTGVGAGKVKLTSAGVFLGLRYGL